MRCVLVRLKEGDTGDSNMVSAYVRACPYQKTDTFPAFSLAHRSQRDQPASHCRRQLFFLVCFCFSFSVFNGRLLSLKMDGNVSFKKGLTARELKRNARRREITKRGKEDKAKAKAQGEPSSRPRVLGALRSKRK